MWSPSDARPVDRRVLAGLGVACLLVLAGCSFSPQKVCYSCEEGIRASEQFDWGNTTIKHSELHVQVYQNGTAEWTVRTQLSESTIRESRLDTSRLAKAVVPRLEAEVRGTYLQPFPDREPSVSVRNGTLVASFVTDDVAYHTFRGVLLFDHFHDASDGGGKYGMGADRLVVHSPPGMRITNSPDGATLADGGQTAAWDGGSFRAGTFVAFDDDAGSWAGTRAAAATLLHSVRWAAPHLFGYGIALGMFTVLLLVMGLLPSDTAAPIRREGWRVGLRSASDRRRSVAVVVALVVGALFVIGSRPDPDAAFVVLGGQLLLFGVFGSRARTEECVSLTLLLSIVGLTVLFVSVAFMGAASQDFLGPDLLYTVWVMLIVVLAPVTYGLGWFLTRPPDGA